MVVSGEVKNVFREYKGSVGLTIDSHQRITYGDLLERRRKGWHMPTYDNIWCYAQIAIFQVTWIVSVPCKFDVWLAGPIKF